MLVFDELETVRSVQLYGTDPVYVGKATEILCAEYGVAPHRPQLRLPGAQGDPQGRRRRAARGSAGCSAEILEHAVAAAAPYDVPVTMKTRKGIDDDHLTYLDAGRIAAGGRVRRDRAARPDRGAGLLRDAPTGTRSPRWSTTSTSRCSATATSGRRPTRCGWSRRPAPPVSSSAAAAWAGRGCSATSRRRSPASRSRPCPTLGEVAAMMRRHAELLVQHMGEERGCKEFRKHVSWYLKGFAAGGELRRSLALMVDRWPSSTRCWRGSTPTSRSRSPSWARRAAARARPATRWPCPRAGSTTPTAPAVELPRTRPRPPAGEPGTSH